MIKHILTIASLVVATAASALTLTVDGKSQTVDTVDISVSSNRVTVTTNRSNQPAPVDPTPVEPTPVEPPPVTSCRNTSVVSCQGTINWANPGPRTVVGIPGSTVIYTWEFTTTSDQYDSGTVTMSEVVGFEPIVREMWISRVPGGAEEHFRCKTSGVSARSVPWSNQVNRFRCELKPNTKYFLNIKNSNCPSNRTCQLYRNFLK